MICVTWSGEHFVIDVRDTGCGIAAEHQGRVCRVNSGLWRAPDYLSSRID